MSEIPTTLQDASDLGHQVADAIYSDLVAHNVPGFIAAPIAHLIGAIPAAGGLIFMSVLALLGAVIVPTAVATLQAISQLRQDGAPELSKVAAAVMGEFLGFEVPEDHLVGGVGIEANIARAKTLGSALHDLLTHEFGGDGVVTPASGAAAARVFSGYNMNFAAQNAIISVMFDALSLHEFEQVRELGVEVAENLGLGRLHRQAMRPLIDNLIVKPYDRFMREKYRQDTLNEQQTVQAYLTGDIAIADCRRTLAEKGYADNLIDIIIKVYTPHLSEHEIDALVRRGDITRDAGIEALRHNGWTTEFAALKLSAVDAARELRMQQTLASELLQLGKDRYITPEQVALQLRQLNFDDKEQSAMLSVLGTYLEHQYRHFTLSEILYMVDRNIITEQDVDDWAASIGFNDQDRVTLSLFFASKELDYEQAVQAKKDAAAKKKAAADAKLLPKTPPAG